MAAQHDSRFMRLAALLALAVVTLGALPNSAAAQHQGGHGAHRGGTDHGQYAGQQSRTVAAFSEEEVEGHLDGRGLGYARPAELNGYPGPMHVLELKSELALTPDQIAVTEALFKTMKIRARAAGQSYIEAEKALDAAFKSAAADTPTNAVLVRAADARRAEKRLAHLEAHIEMSRILSNEQRASYRRLRGYTAAGKN